MIVASLSRPILGLDAKSASGAQFYRDFFGFDGLHPISRTGTSGRRIFELF
jgi:hypothetical protein